MPFFDTGVVSNVAGTQGVYLDKDGWLIVPGQLPQRIRREPLANGNVKRSLVLLDDGKEKTIASTEVP
jgi:hypothetical protein